MDRLYSSSREILSRRFEQLSKWRKGRKTERKFKCSQFHLSVIRGYVRRLNVTADSILLSPDSLLNQEFPDQVQDQKVASFLDALQEVFVVPQQHQLFDRDADIKTNGRIAAFIDMLIRLLHNWPARLVNSEEDRLKSLKKGLKFLLGVLGDESFIYNVQHLWPDFEAVANKAGSFVHLIIFSTKADRIDKRFFRAVLRDMDDLEAKIINLSTQQPCINDAWITRKAPALDSLFIVHSLLNDLQDLLDREDNTIHYMKYQIKTVQNELNLLNSSIKNQEMGDLKEYYLVRIRDVAYEAEYLISYFLDGDDDGDAPNSHAYLSIRLSHVTLKIKSIKLGIQGCKTNVDNDASRLAQLPLQTKSSNDASEVIGIDKEMEIMEYLDGGKQDLQMVFIVGMAGLGKTTLARKLYHHPSLKHRFDVCSWCVVSQQYEKKSLLIDILGTLKDMVDKEEMWNKREESVTTMIHQFLYGRRFFIILDDVWSSDAWFDLQACFPDNKNGSRILLTSRNRNVAPTDSIICKLSPMSNEHCWELLRKKVFQNEPCPPQLLNIGQRIAKNCRGLPLAVVVTAGILSSMDTREENTWKAVEGNLASYILSEESNSIMQMLENHRYIYIY